MAKDVSKYNSSFEAQVKGLAVGDNNIIYNYFGYREELKPTPVDAADDNLPCPYRGLFHFGPDDAEYFFGREVFIKELFEATQNRNFIPLLGASGSGKSSVVLAGLVPRLIQEGHWKFTHFRPGSDPFHALALALVPLYTKNLDDTDQIIQARKLSQSLSNGEIPLGDVFAQIHQNNPTHKVLLIADQFEEIYTLCADHKIRHSFLDALLASFQPSSSQSQCDRVLVTTMRADFLGNGLSYRPFADVLQNADIKLGPMNREELTQVIKKPSEKLGVAFQEGLVERILDDVDSEPGNLPLLEFALTQLWEKRTGKQLTNKAYEEIGEVQGALTRHADENYRKLSKTEQEQVRRIFIQLVRPGEGTEDTRRLATKAELNQVNWRLVNQLADARLVVTSRNAEDKETVEVVHEALIRNWGELRQWMDTDRNFRAWQERLRVGIYQWKQMQQDEGALLRGAALAEAEEKLKQRGEDLSGEQDFIRASIALRDREERQRERAERRTILGLTVGFVLALGLSGFAMIQRQIADNATKRLNCQLAEVKEREAALTVALLRGDSLNKFLRADSEELIKLSRRMLELGAEWKNKKIFNDFYKDYIYKQRIYKDFPVPAPRDGNPNDNSIRLGEQDQGWQDYVVLNNWIHTLDERINDWDYGHGRVLSFPIKDIRQAREHIKSHDSRSKLCKEEHLNMSVNINI